MFVRAMCPKKSSPQSAGCFEIQKLGRPAKTALLLPSALLVAILTELLAALVTIDLGLTAFLQ
jgi:hypothetical protein